MVLKSNPGEFLAQRAQFWYEISVRQGLTINKHTSPRTIAVNLRALQRGLTGDRARIASDYMEEQGALQAYLLYYWAVSFFEATIVLSELGARNQLPAIHSVLDIGSGPGPASFAANVFGAEKSFLIDKSESALAVASGIAAAGRHENAEFEIIARRAELENFHVPPGEMFDLIVASHSLNELWHEETDWLERRRDFVRRLLPGLRTGGILLIIEPSAHYTSIPLLTLRDVLISAQTQERTLACIGPCPHTESCPLRALEGRPCFSEWQWNAPALVNELAGSAGLDRNSLKAAWVAFRKVSPDNGGTKVLSGTPGSQADPDILRGRIVSEPMQNKAGRIRYIVCTDYGLLRTISAPQNDPSTRALGFFQLARGDLIEAERLEARGDTHLGIAPGTRIRIVMKAPRV